ncbi:MAG: polyphosphate polymerase domain-containing protein [Tannerellaceae bacterium]|jgi:hypothetical protein|nr:polyphosphate polymerase domain-containing protein [Tannerellaceae bacterium]
MNTRISEIAAAMPVVTLEEISHLRLMERVDCKYVAPASLLPRLMEQMCPLFRMQVNGGTGMADYSTQYLDTCDLGMFVMHQNGKLNRQKIRIRSYVGSCLSFLEIKSKNNKGRTSKQRIPVCCAHLSAIDELPAEGKLFLDTRALVCCEALEPALSNKFRRMTFVNNRDTERVTIDLHLSFLNHRTGREAAVEGLMILELKQDGRQESDFREILHRERIKPVAFSKYCMGTVLTNPGAKYNRFKSRWAAINKLIG